MIRLLAGDCRDVLATLPADSVQCVVTSPPYYGLRDYGTAQWDGGDAACDHAQKRSMGATTLRLDGREHLGAYDGEKATQIGTPYRASCGKCGAVRVDRQIGLEPTPAEYLATMVGVFREVRRVLRADGTCWVNMGDSYASTNGKTNGGSDFSRWKGGQTLNDREPANERQTGLKPKDLLLMPARLALALQADGWWVRSDIIWHKPNPMPESVTDRPTSAHEHVFLLTRSSRYFYDAAAVAEPAIHEGRVVEYDGTQKNSEAALDPRMRTRIAKDTTVGATRSLRNVWTIATAPYSQAHFATYPPALAERCIKAGTSERGCCGQCGKPWVRVTERQTVRQLADAQGTWAERPAAEGYGNAAMTTQRRDATSGLSASNSHNASTPRAPLVTTTGWRAGCDHNADVVPCVVLDCFAGAGTTLLCADRLQRDAIGIELNPGYTEMAMERCRADAPLFVDVPAADPQDERIADLFAPLEAAE